MDCCENERLDEVNDRLRLIQRTDGLTFGTDALLLAAFIRGDPRDKALEFGTGSGIISLLVATRRKAGSILAVEAQAEYAALAERNVTENGLSDRISVVHADLREVTAYGGDGCDLLFTNPPYMTVGGGFPNATRQKNLARHEVLGNVADFCKAAARKLRFGGRFFCVYRPDRIADLFVSMRQAGIEPKRMTAVTASRDILPSLILVEGRRGGAPGLVMTPVLQLYRDSNHSVYSDEMEYILEHGSFRDVR